MKSLRKLILGTAQFGLDYGVNNSIGKISSSEACEILCYARSKGILTLDTASAYGDAEEKIGNYHSSAETSFDVITKFDKLFDLGWEESIQLSLKKIKVPIVEAAMFHSFSSYQDSKADLKIIQAKGKGKYFKRLGVSVYTNEELEELLNDDNVELVQLPFNLLDNDSHRNVILQKLKDAGKIIHTRSVFLQGLFYKSLTELPPTLISLKPHLLEARQIADEAEVDIGVLALQYVLSKDYIDGVLIGIDSKDQLEKNIHALNQKINPVVFEKIDAIRVNNVDLLNPSKW
ncbi:aldo/keto reductase [Sphingobacterium bovistauri]|uniref:Aldo/keto reductase n=1 Tax=Sphingobacterium bovistauri TaxID=2781959 RepID=A0ABS7Z1N8_9SPHI|nr:aldo/keto reductase [Sphingobacterium bovistauri]MCA5004084.1 aldo/keto reductase [Sphingobacterium bovistauri]